MKKSSLILLSGALTLLLLTAACAEATATTIVTTGPAEETASPLPPGTDATASPFGALDTATVPAGTDLAGPPATDTNQTPEVPVTGEEFISMEGQFCIQDMAHALLVLADTATFETVTTSGPDTGCNTVDLYNGRQIVLCRARENTALNLNICTDATTCTQMLLELQDCPDVAQPGSTSLGTPEAGVPTNTGVAAVTDTPAAVGPTATP